MVEVQSLPRSLRRVRNLETEKEDGDRSLLRDENLHNTLREAKNKGKNKSGDLFRGIES